VHLRWVGSWDEPVSVVSGPSAGGARPLVTWGSRPRLMLSWPRPSYPPWPIPRGLGPGPQRRYFARAQGLGGLGRVRDAAGASLVLRSGPAPTMREKPNKLAILRFESRSTHRIGASGRSIRRTMSGVSVAVQPHTPRFLMLSWRARSTARWEGHDARSAPTSSRQRTPSTELQQRSRRTTLRADRQ
jgi:hypothetical protein